MRVADFDYDLPAEAIAQRPAVPRDSARLLVVGESLEDRGVRDLPVLLRTGDVMVFNDTRVIPSRLAGRRGETRIEATLIEQLASHRWRALVRPARRLRIGDTVAFADGLAATVEDKDADGSVMFCFDLAGTALGDFLENHGTMPLPPYIKRPDLADDRDKHDYQTVYAAQPGAVAAPTAGLHFTDDLLAALDSAGIVRVSVTLHVGAGTFLPVKTENARDHVLHTEWGCVGADAAEAVNSARGAGGRVVAVGTTALRLLESAVDVSGRIAPFEGKTDFFILPGYAIRAVDVLLTNFHLPCSTLLMLVSAFAGTDRIRRAYAHALDMGYRFYSYGDACLLYPEAA